VVAKGGDGGFGNAHFKSSTRQTPKIAELGEQGEAYQAELELKLLADVGLVGFPNAGKSTFLSVVSNAKPEIADYEFTTLTPNLGVADIDDGTLLIADIPGLIEGASEGKGLGDAFLRHIERTGVLLHLIDGYSDDIAKSYQAIRNELSAYSQELVTRPEVVALTKTEGLDEELIDMQLQALKTVVAKGTPIFAISSTAHKGVVDVLRELRRQVVARRTVMNEVEDEQDEAMPVITIGEAPDDAWTVEKSDDIYIVHGKKIEKFARRTNFEQFQAVNRLRDIMNKMGISHEIIRQGAQDDSIVQIGGSEFTLVEQ
jgi:GTP-binding protein